MKKKGKTLKYSFFALLITLLLVPVTYAWTVGVENFNKEVPTAQGWVNLSNISKRSSSSYATVNLSYMTPDAVTFYAKAVNHSYGSGKTVTQTNTDFSVYYDDAIYGQGQSMTARFRNHNWSLNLGQVIGQIDYR